MTYATSNPPALISQRIAGGPAVWYYKSTDVAATVNGAGYFTNGNLLGMRAGDTIRIYDTTTPLVTWAWVSTVNATTNAVSTTAG